ncbi:ArgS-related anticodon-binding protein NrtL [Actinacidiphila yeochonensis]|uniref:ArgS-related anticodon-binding protein NrtL n=1 Tax=Actinacidiphila yeochonensis TaxID=89050 RepID=UPI00056D3FA4|nr:DALR anticodon-binding domain-containing protein [Actinacidiphila yeochonensis]
MTPAELSRVVLTAVRRAVDAAELAVEVPERAAVQRPPRADCGDFASNVALKLAGPAGLPPREVAEILRRRLLRDPGIAAVEVAGAGFLNITLSTPAYDEVVRRVRELGEAYGTSDAVADERVTVAPAVPGAVRGTLTADVVNQLLRAAGARPAQPGGPYELLVVVEPRYDELGGREAGGENDGEIGDETGGETGDGGAGNGTDAGAPVPAPVPATAPGEPAAPGPAAPSLGRLEALLGPDAARWALLRPPAGDEPRLGPADRAVLLAQREANPLFRVRYAHARTRALLRNARDLGVDVDGALDPRENPENPENPGPQSAPALGNDLRNDPRDPPVRPPAATTRQDQDPERAPTPAASGPPPAYHPAETELLGLVADYPRVVESAARRRAPDRIARHLERLADAFARFHDECPPLPKGDEKPSAVHAARVRLADAAGIVLAVGLRTLGIGAPDRV